MSPRLISFAGLVLMASGVPAQQRTPVITDPARADADFSVQGEYVGTIRENGKPHKYGVRIGITANPGEFRAIAFRGGLPGDGWDRKLTDEKNRRLAEWDGRPTAAGIAFPRFPGGSALIRDGNLIVRSTSGEEVGQLKPIVRQSPTLGAKPPPGAIVLFDGSGLEHFLPKAKKTEDRLLMIPARTREKFIDFVLHVEFRIPYRRPHAGHSGIYLQNSYHLAVSARSFGGGAVSDLGCGGIRWVRAPDENMCFPPLTWQTFDIDYTAARFEENGKPVHRPIVTIRQNGVVIHDRVELPENPPVYRGGGTDTLSPQGGPLHFQSHADDAGFVYRNIWLLEKK